jgi:bifunctional UDP-N-acetylglucosamine pyrophosphorylase/glucosamine-1-phosphate N-acetyltransferase
MSIREAASVIMAAGRGSRMRGFEGNKTLLPLVSGPSPLEGSDPILLHILNSLPPGPKAAVVNHKKEDVIHATRSLGLTYCEQPVLNGTGGALLAAREFLEARDQDRFIITMGDVPFVKNATYLRLLNGLEDSSLIVLGFCPEDKKQYGVLETDGGRVTKITEWKYWRTFSKEHQQRLRICNSGIYGARKMDLLQNLLVLEKRPHAVTKERNGKMVEVEEFFITDLVELMVEGGLKVGYVIADDETEVMGVDDLPSLIKAQEIFKQLD